MTYPYIPATAAGDTPLERWYRLSQRLCALATTQIVDATAAPERIRLVAGLDQVIAGAEAGAELSPGIIKAMAEEMSALWDWFNTEARTPLADPRAHGKSPIQILSELGEA